MVWLKKIIGYAIANFLRRLSHSITPRLNSINIEISGLPQLLKKKTICATNLKNTRRRIQMSSGTQEFFHVITAHVFKLSFIDILRLTIQRQ